MLLISVKFKTIKPENFRKIEHKKVIITQSVTSTDYSGEKINRLSTREIKTNSVDNKQRARKRPED